MRRSFFTLTLTALAATTLLTACNNEKTEKDNTPVAAVINGEAIHESSIIKAMTGIPTNLVQGREAQVRQQILGQIVQRNLVLQQASKLNLKEDKAYREQVKNMIDNLTYNTVLQKALSDKMTDELLMKRYEETKEARAFPAVKARHILVEKEKDAKDIIRIATPENFTELAKEKSKGPTGPNGGDLGWFRKEAMVPEFAEVAFKANKGKIVSKPVKTQFGWHVIYVEDKNDKFVPTFDTVKDSLRAEMSQVLIQEYLKELSEQAVISYPEAKKIHEAEAK